MPKFLNTTGVSYHLEELIKATQEKLILISPYLQFNVRIKEHLHNLNLQKKDIRIVFRENKLQPEDANWLGGQIGVRPSLCKTLHAKCYLNEKEAIITSMNLYEFSQSHNNEMGIYIQKDLDPELYQDTLQEAQRLVTISEEIRLTDQKAAVLAPAKSIVVPNASSQPTGYCIRSGVKIPFNIKQPLSAKAYESWKKFKDAEYPEKYCHFSGELSEGETCHDRPILQKNWKRAKEKFDL
jgi:phosphatidylserine/phosphatidylglycerophosphate/cardiolipin synthase-like enzyme